MPQEAAYEEARSHVFSRSCPVRIRSTPPDSATPANQVRATWERALPVPRRCDACQPVLRPWDAALAIYKAFLLPPPCIFRQFLPPANSSCPLISTVLTMTSAQDPITITAHCLCKAHIFTASVPKSKLPLSASACHCDSCRHVTGALYSVDAPWPEPRAQVDVSKLKVYHIFPCCDLLFCGTCSTPMFFANPEKPDEELGVFTGTIRNDSDDLVSIDSHICVGDTKDGGASMWMRKPNASGSEAKRYKERARGDNVVEYPFDWPDATSFTGFEAKTDSKVPVRCKCKGVDLVWHAGGYEDKKAEELPWFIDPVTHKALGGFCGCDSCRLASGVDLWNWTFAELKNLFFSDQAQQTPFPKHTADLKALVDSKDPAVGTLAYYQSSPDVQRYFCSTCSATIFYATDSRPEIVDVAIGLLEASDGARAEGFLSWAFGVIGRMDDAAGGWRYGLYERVAKECEDWRISRGYPKNWMRIRREEAAKKAQS